MLEEGDTVDVNLSEVKLIFKSNGDYAYYSTLDYSEQGKFNSAGNYLYSTPNNQDTIVDRKVEIITLTPLELYIRMDARGKERILQFQKAKQND